MFVRKYPLVVCAIPAGPRRSFMERTEAWPIACAGNLPLAAASPDLASLARLGPVLAPIFHLSSPILIAARVRKGQVVAPAFPFIPAANEMLKCCVIWLARSVLLHRLSAPTTQPILLLHDSASHLSPSPTGLIYWSHRSASPFSVNASFEQTHMITMLF